LKRTYVLACDARDSLNATAEEDPYEIVELGKEAAALRSSLSFDHSCFSVLPLISYAKTSERAGDGDRQCRGRRPAQPEGTVLNLVNWVCNVIAPVGAALAVVMAVVAYSQGRGVERWAVTAGGLLVVSGLTRLIEFWIQNGTAGCAVAKTGVLNQ